MSLENYENFFGTDNILYDEIREASGRPAGGEREKGRNPELSLYLFGPAERRAEGIYLGVLLENFESGLEARVPVTCSMVGFD